MAVNEHWIHGNGRRWMDRLGFVVLPLVVAAALLALVVYEGAGMAGWISTEAGQGPSVAATPEKAAPVQSQPSRTVSGRQIASLHLFGEAKEAEPEPTPVPVKAPETKLNLTLHGIFIFSGPRDGAAIIGQRGGEQVFCRTGEKLEGGATLVEVRLDHVLLQRNGKFESLRFPESGRPELRPGGPDGTPGNVRPRGPRVVVPNPQRLLGQARSN